MNTPATNRAAATERRATRRFEKSQPIARAPVIATVARCIFPGGKAVLVAYDADDRILLGIGCNPKNVRVWAQSGTSADDRRRMEREAREHYSSPPAPVVPPEFQAVPTRKTGDRVQVTIPPAPLMGRDIGVHLRPGTLLRFNHHLDFWHVQYDAEPGVYYHVSEEHMQAEGRPDPLDEALDAVNDAFAE